MKKKGFTLVELLVVIAIIAMLLAILMPALGKVRQLAQRIMCGTNIGGIGKAILTYATDDKYESYPIAGPSGTLWDYGTGSKDSAVCSWDWRKKDPPGSAGNLAGETPKSTISANLYLLVKFSDVSPDQFVCPGSEEKKFDLSLYDIPGTTEYGMSFTDFWDFGNNKSGHVKTGKTRGRGHNSYSYHLPLPLAATGAEGISEALPCSGVSNPAKAVIADRNPYWDFVANQGQSTGSGAELYEWDADNKRIVPESIPNGNNVYHQKDGQNVLYVDQHVKFERSANCGIQMDNIYTTWELNDTELQAKSSDQQLEIRQCGETEPKAGTGKNNYVRSAEDNYLVSDYN